MIGNDMATPAFRPRLHDLILAFGLLTRLPVPLHKLDPNETRPAAHAAWAYPLVGAATGALASFVGWICLLLGLPPAAAALFVVLAAVLLTGAMHEDGLADCADGFWGGWTRERRLAIMKDSQIGTYGVLALFLALALRAVAVTALMSAGQLAPALIGAAGFSRAAMVWVMYTLPNARTSGLSGQTGRPPAGAMATAVILGLLTALIVVPAPFLIVATTGIAATLGLQQIANRKIGGQTGDVLGATQQIIEITVLLTCLAALH